MFKRPAIRWAESYRWASILEKRSSFSGGLSEVKNLVKRIFIQWNCLRWWVEKVFFWKKHLCGFFLGLPRFFLSLLCASGFYFEAGISPVLLKLTLSTRLGLVVSPNHWPGIRFRIHLLECGSQLACSLRCVSNFWACVVFRVKEGCQLWIRTFLEVWGWNLERFGEETGFNWVWFQLVSQPKQPFSPEKQKSVAWRLVISGELQAPFRGWQP